jgi:hypothetical protein
MAIATAPGRKAEEAVVYEAGDRTSRMWGQT